MQIGDDLTKARCFVDTAQAGLAGMSAAHEVADVLVAIQDDAMEMHARGIVRGAECALMAISEAQNPEQVQGLIFSLTRLVEQYREGLDEIAPVQAKIIEIDTRTERARAKDTLAPLIKFAPASEQRAALQFLAGFEVEYTAVPTGQNVPARKELSGVNLETMMPTVTDQILSDARRAGKSVSVSYAVGDIVIAEDLASEIQNFLTELGARLVTDTLASPKIRQAAGLPASGLINITAKEEHGTLALHIECSGQSHAKATVNLRSLSPLISRSGIFSIEQLGDNTIARLINVALSFDLPTHASALVIEPVPLRLEAIL